MSVRAIVGSSLLVLATACSYAPSAEPPRPIKPEDGPKASIRVQFTGANIYRQLEPSFIVDENAYVMVGHLGGDGMIRVLYPTAPTAAASRVEAGKTIRVPRTDAIYDADPSRFSFATRPYRRMSAEMDSYDGMGHGYVFLIASRYPMDFAPAMDGRVFGEMDVADYGSIDDPRLAVRRFADVLTGGPYTLKFASAYSTRTYGVNSGMCSGYIGGGYNAFGNYWGGFSPMYSNWMGYRGSTMIVPIFWGGWMPSYAYVGGWDTPRLSRCGGGGFSYYRVFRVSGIGRNVYPWIEPPIVIGGGGGVTPTLTRGRSSFDRPTIVTRLADNPTRAARPRGRGTTSLAKTTPDPIIRTKAASFDRPGLTRPFTETAVWSRNRSAFPMASSGFRTGRGGSFNAPSGTSRTDNSGSTTHTAASSTSSSGASSGAAKASSGPSGKTTRH